MPFCTPEETEEQNQLMGSLAKVLEIVTEDMEVYQVTEDMESYNGWKNKATWNVSLWIDYHPAREVLDDDYHPVREVLDDDYHPVREVLDD